MRFIFLFIVLTPILGQAQDSILVIKDTSYVFESLTEYFTKTRRRIKKNEPGNKVLTYKYCYHNPGVIDGGYCEELTLEIKDASKWIKGAVFNVETDWSAVRVRYDLSSVWNWGTDDVEISGTIKVLSNCIFGVKVKLNIVVIPKYGHTAIKYRGRVTFR